MAVSKIIQGFRKRRGKKRLRDPLEPNRIELKTYDFCQVSFLFQKALTILLRSHIFLELGRLQLALLLAGWLLQFQTYGGTKNWIQNS